MKHTIMGFRQDKLIKFGLDIIDASILRYFIDFKESNGMNTREVEGHIYYWLRYDAVLREFPIFRMKKCTVQSRFFKLRDSGMLTHLVVREKGTYSFFGIGENYKELITREGVEEENSKGISEEAKGMDEEFKGCGFKSTTNNPSTKDSSTKINKNLLLKKSAFEIIEYLNLKTGKKL
ncbi:TPA: hypothetical protein JRS25_003517 [Escherichia coli]|nr:hypothetical protein [Escherichia coli]